MSSGTIVINPLGNSSSHASFEVNSAAADLTMSGGTIVLDHASTGSGPDYRVFAGTAEIKERARHNLVGPIS
jgi:hypothetical protein